MNLARLRYLDLVLTHGSFSEAARAAGVSQPAISQAMRALEQETGVRLFEGTGRSRIPTVAARELAERSRPVHQLVQSLAPRPEVCAAREPETVLRIGLAPAASLLYLPAIESAVRGIAPDGLVRCHAGQAPDLLDAMLRGELDCVAVPMPRRFTARGIERHLLHTSVPLVYARLGHPLSHASSLEDLAEAGWAVSGRSGTAGNVIEEACRVRRLPRPRVVMRCSDYWTMISLLAQSDLLGVVPHRALLPADHASRLQSLMIREGLPTYEVFFFWPRRPPEGRGAALDAVVAALTSLPPQ